MYKSNIPVSKHNSVYYTYTWSVQAASAAVMSARNIWRHRNRKPLLPIYYHSRRGFHTCLAFYHDYHLS